MARGRRWFVRLVMGLAVAYAAFVFLGGLALRGPIERRVRDRLARALGADQVTIGSASLSIWRGELALEDVVARRTEGGAMDLRIGAVEAQVAGWGAVLFDRDVRRVSARRLGLELSARGLAEVARRERRPATVQIEEIVIEDAVIAVAPSALMPGLGRVELKVKRAESRAVGVAGALSWLTGLRELEGELSAPGGVALGVTYAPDKLSLRGRLVAERSISVPFRMPDLDPAADEIDQLRALAAAAVRAAGGLLTGQAAREAALRMLERVMK